MLDDLSAEAEVPSSAKKQLLTDFLNPARRSSTMRGIDSCATASDRG
jgi:hypothetical protein